MKDFFTPMKIPQKWVCLLAMSFVFGQQAFSSENYVTESIAVSADIMQQKSKTVVGTVTDNGEPIIGASVVVKNAGKGVITDMDGNFKLDVPVGATIVISYVGYDSKEIVYKGESTLKVELSEDVLQLQEVQVVAYGVTKKVTVTGAISSVGTEEILKSPVSSISNALTGKLPGLSTVQQTGQPGADDATMYVRGVGSLTEGLSSPLVLVDGVERSFNQLDPNEIEDISILKDASSTAVFGVRGANGVIIITTKKAKEGKTQVSINGSVGWKKVTDRVSLTNAEQFKMLYNEQRMNQGGDPYDYTVWNADTDWQDEMFQTGFLTNNTVSITASGDRSKFYLGLGYVMEEGSIKSEKLNKFTVNLHSEHKVTDFLRFGFQVNGVRALYPDAKGVGSALKAAPIAPVYDTESGLLHTLPDFQRAQVWNPMIEPVLRGAHNKSANYRMAGNIYGELDLMKNLTFKATFSLDYASSQSRSYSPLIYVYNPDVEGGKERLTDKESISQSKSTSMAAQSDYVLTYINQFGDHGLTLTAGLTTNYNEYSDLSGGRSQLPGYGVSIGEDIDKWWITMIDDATSATNGGSQYKRFTMSYLFRALYNYKNRYLLNASYRRDGSSVFKRTGNTWDNFYSFGAGWVMSEEAFMKKQNVIDYLKLKGSWGVLGSQNTGGSRYPAYPNITSSGSAVFGDNVIAGKGPDKLISQTLGWERNYSWEVGFDMHLLDGRMQISPVYYNKTTKDLLTSVPGLSGTVPALQNTGEIRNRGFELAASWSDKIGENWRYGVSANLTTIDNEVVSLISKDYSIINGVSRVSEGYPIGYFYGYKVAGVYQNETDIETSAPNQVASVKPGDLKFADVNGDGIISEKDRTMIGNPTPDFTYGFSVNLGYKNFDLSVDMMGVYGNEVYRNWDSSAYAQFNYRTGHLNRWHGEGTSNWDPILDPSRSVNLEASSYYVEDGSFFRIRNIELGYTFDPRLLNRIKLQSLRIYGNVQNPKTWSRNTGYTPEVGGSATAFGVDGGGYPMPVVYTLGFNLSF